MRWSRVIFRGAKTHFVPTRLRDTVVADLKNRGSSVSDAYPDKLGWPIDDDITSIGVASGGFTYVGVPIIDVRLGTVRVRFSVDDLEPFYYQLQGLKKRHELGETTYKLHGNMHCIVLLPQQRTALLHRMPKLFDQADQMWADFMKEREEKFGKPKPIRGGVT